LQNTQCEAKAKNKMNKESEYFQYKNKNVYELDDLIKYDQLYFHGCLKYKREAIIKKQISEEHNFYAKNKDGCWVESTSKYSRAKILISEEWVKANVSKFVDATSPTLRAPQPSTSRVVKTYKNAPELVILEDREKFRDNDNNVFEVEVRGCREEDKIFFKGLNVQTVFGMTNIVKDIRKEQTNYVEKDDYEIFLLASGGDSPQEASKILALNSKNLATFFTYNGLLKVIFNSRCGVAYKFRKSIIPIIILFIVICIVVSFFMKPVSEFKLFHIGLLFHHFISIKCRSPFWEKV